MTVKFEIIAIIYFFNAIINNPDFKSSNLEGLKDFKAHLMPHCRATQYIGDTSP